MQILGMDGEEDVCVCQTRDGIKAKIRVCFNSHLLEHQSIRTFCHFLNIN